MQPDRGPVYGSPLRICPFCGNGYVDSDYIELALKNPKKSFKRRSIIGRTAMIALRSIIIWVILMPVCLLLSSALNIDLLNINENQTGLIWLFIIAVIISTVIYFPTPKRMQEDSENLEEVWQESFRRLQNPVYVKNLQRAGYHIPEEISTQLIGKNIVADEKSLSSTLGKAVSSTVINETDPLSENNEFDYIPKDTLLKLKELHDKGVLTDEEFAEKKKQILKI